MKDVDRLFEDEPTPPALTPPPLPPSGFPEDPPELRERLVSAIGGEMRSFEYVDKRLDMLAAEVRDGFDLLGKQILPQLGKLADGQERMTKRMEEFHRMAVALGERHNELVMRQEEQDARLDSLEQRVAKLEKVQRPKRARKR